MPGKSKTNILPGKVSLIIHEPIDISSYNEENIKNLMNKVKQTLNN